MIGPACLSTILTLIALLLHRWHSQSLNTFKFDTHCISLLAPRLTHRFHRLLHANELTKSLAFILPLLIKQSHITRRQLTRLTVRLNGLLRIRLTQGVPRGPETASRGAALPLVPPNVLEGLQPGFRTQVPVVVAAPALVGHVYFCELLLVFDGFLLGDEGCRDIKKGGLGEGRTVSSVWRDLQSWSVANCRRALRRLSDLPPPMFTGRFCLAAPPALLINYWCS